MQITFDEIYIFCSKSKPNIYLYKVDPITDHSNVGFIMGKDQNWNLITIDKFNELGLTLIGKYKK